MIFQHTIENVLNGTKTQTSRIVKPGDYIQYADTGAGETYHVYIEGVYRNRRPLWKVGNTYAVQPGRGQKAVARIRILQISKQDVRHITAEEARAEGFNSEVEFFEVWCKMHDPKGFELLAKPYYGHWMDFLHRPAERYTAWVIRFELVK